VQSTLGRREVSADQVLVNFCEQHFAGVYLFENDGFDSLVPTEAFHRLQPMASRHQFEAIAYRTDAVRAYGFPGRRCRSAEYLDLEAREKRLRLPGRVR
jgi:hypothetical protein